MIKEGDTLKGFIKHYVVFHQLAADTVAWYHRAISVYCTWARGDVLLEDFNGEQISKMLLAKERAGRSPYYIKSLRGALVAILHEIRGDAPIERVRRVKTRAIDPAGLTTEQVERLLAATNDLEGDDRWRYRITLALGYYTGLNACDIWNLERKHFTPDGSLYYRRRKTGTLVFVKIPADLLEDINRHCPRKGPIVPLVVTKEWFRRRVGQLFDKAGCMGSFKTLRSTSGSIVEAKKPGTGHKHLGNTRAIFERHYESKRITMNEPTTADHVKLPAHSRLGGEAK